MQMLSSQGGCGWGRVAWAHACTQAQKLAICPAPALSRVRPRGRQAANLRPVATRRPSSASALLKSRGNPCVARPWSGRTGGSGTRSRLKCAVFSISWKSCISSGPRGPADRALWLSASGLPAEVVRVGMALSAAGGVGCVMVWVLSLGAATGWRSGGACNLQCGCVLCRCLWDSARSCATARTAHAVGAHHAQAQRGSQPPPRPGQNSTHRSAI